MLRALGCFPVDFPTSGVPRYRSLSPALAYSICLYAAINVSALFNIRHHLLQLLKKDNDFRDSIYTCKFITMLANCTCVPVLGWLDTPTVVQYFRKWEHFQMMFVNVTREHLVLNTKTCTTHRIILMCIAATSMFLLKFFPPYLQFWHLPCHCVSLLMLSTNTIVFTIMFRCLVTAGTSLNKCFQVRMYS
ncbi:hypothetical protein B7P43_G18265 [Cryptotermes secundus]|uniref:Gustatory receptor n=1 Tax=Cryptotermes secundus TaxID=105785 RepID=A0A2J7RGF4_9NEOP|nr:hypothetical protein B7P43_G18265 [Cryptotermes secundus]